MRCTYNGGLALGQHEQRCCFVGAPITGCNGVLVWQWHRFLFSWRWVSRTVDTLISFLKCTAANMNGTNAERKNRWESLKQTVCTCSKKNNKCGALWNRWHSTWRRSQTWTDRFRLSTLSSLFWITWFIINIIIQTHLTRLRGQQVCLSIYYALAKLFRMSQRILAIMRFDWNVLQYKTAGGSNPLDILKWMLVRKFHWYKEEPELVAQNIQFALGLLVFTQISQTKRLFFSSKLPTSDIVRAVTFLNTICHITSTAFLLPSDEDPYDREFTHLTKQFIKKNMY